MAERRERILAAAREIIADEGFEALTTRALAERARVTVPTIYNLVGARDAVLFAAVEDQTARLLAVLGQRAEAPPIERVLAVTEDCVAELVRMPRYYGALLRLMFTSDSGSALRRSVGRTLLREFLYGVEALYEAGELVDLVPARMLAERLTTDLTASSTQWATGDIDEAALHRNALLGTCVLMLGTTTGEARREVERRLEELGRAPQGVQTGPQRSGVAGSKRASEFASAPDRGRSSPSRRAAPK